MHQSEIQSLLLPTSYITGIRQTASLLVHAHLLILQDQRRHANRSIVNQMLGLENKKFVLQSRRVVKCAHVRTDECPFRERQNCCATKLLRHKTVARRNFCMTNCH